MEDGFLGVGYLMARAKTNGYGDPYFPDGPERFRDAYRHIIDLFRKEDVKNITWCFHVYPPQGTGECGGAASTME